MAPPTTELVVHLAATGERGWIYLQEEPTNALKNPAPGTQHRASYLARGQWPETRQPCWRGRMEAFVVRAGENAQFQIWTKVSRKKWSTRCITFIYFGSQMKTEFHKTSCNIWEHRESYILPSAYLKAGLRSVNENWMYLMSRLGNPIFYTYCVFPCSHKNELHINVRKNAPSSKAVWRSVCTPVMIPTCFGNEASEPVYG